MAAAEETSAQKVSVAAQWDEFWGTVTESNPQITGILAFVGIAIAAWAVIRWIMDARNGGATRAGKGPMWLLFLGLALSAPGMVIPVVLRVFDVIANLVLGLVGGAVGA